MLLTAHISVKAAFTILEVLKRKLVFKRYSFLTILFYV